MEQHWTPKVQAAGLFNAFCPDGAEAETSTLPVLELESQSEELICVIKQVIL